MYSKLAVNEFKLFREYIEEKCGISISESKAYLIETRLSKLLADLGMDSFDELYRAVRNNDRFNTAEKIIDLITTNETLWFRDKTPWNIMGKLLMPKYIEQLRSNQKRKIRIWSAASSTGQEAYSTAMSIDLWLKSNMIKDIRLDQFEILATDISKTVLDIARNGRYDVITIMRGLDPYCKNTYFKKDGSVWAIDDRIKNIVQFRQFNLQNSFMIWGRFDIIFCRYVLIYFSELLRKNVIEKFSSSIEKDGILFIGASEIYEDISTYFDMAHFENGTYYKRKEIK